MNKTISYITQGGVCSRLIEVEITPEGVVENVRFTGGCHGNTQGVAALAKGRPAREIIATLEGIDCKGKGTSCPDQLARALRKALEGQN